MTTIVVYASTDREDMYERGIAAGLSEDAANYLRYFDEIELTLTVDEETGEVISATCKL